MSKKEDIITDLGSRGRVTIPKKVRKDLDLDEGDYVNIDVKKAQMDTEKAKKNMEKQGRPNPREKKMRKDIEKDKNRVTNVFD